MGLVAGAYLVAFGDVCLFVLLLLVGCIIVAVAATAAGAVIWAVTAMVAKACCCCFLWMHASVTCVIVMGVIMVEFCIGDCVSVS